MEIVAGLSSDLMAALFVVVHVPAQATSQLPHILSRAGRLPAIHAKDSEAILPGRIYVAPPDFHLLLRNGSMRLVRGPKENNHRPAIDPLFRSAAQTYGARTIGIVLSGMLDDGTAGLLAIKSRGGITIVQHPEDAVFPDMPRNALAVTPVDYCVSKEQIAGIIADVTRKSDIQMKGAMRASNDEMKEEIEIEAMNLETIADDEKPGTPSVYGCPDCGGTLWELQDDQWLRFRCRGGTCL
jgi:two-component system chemotaxis response regulator CheB